MQKEIQETAVCRSIDYSGSPLGEKYEGSRKKWKSRMALGGLEGNKKFKVSVHAKRREGYSGLPLNRLAARRSEKNIGKYEGSGRVVGAIRNSTFEGVLKEREGHSGLPLNRRSVAILAPARPRSQRQYMAARLMEKICSTRDGRRWRREVPSARTAEARACGSSMAYSARNKSDDHMHLY